jgi:hypothetical protein
VGACDLRFEEYVADVPGVIWDPWTAVVALEVQSVAFDFLNEMPPERVCERLKGIVASSGRSTGAEAQI